jgi:hypothetical protein
MKTRTPKPLACCRQEWPVTSPPPHLARGSRSWRAANWQGRRLSPRPGRGALVRVETVARLEIVSDAVPEMPQEGP